MRRHVPHLFLAGCLLCAGAALAQIAHQYELIQVDRLVTIGVQTGEWILSAMSLALMRQAAYAWLKHASVNQKKT